MPAYHYFSMETHHYEEIKPTDEHWKPKFHEAEVRFNYLTSFAKFPAVNGAEYPSRTT